MARSSLLGALLAGLVGCSSTSKSTAAGSGSTIERDATSFAAISAFAGKIDATNKNLEELAKFIDTAANELDKDGLSAETLNGLRTSGIALSGPDLGTIDLEELGHDLETDVIDYSERAYHIEQLRARLVRSDHLEKVPTTLKSLDVPAKLARFAVRLEMPSHDRPFTVADIVDFGESLDPRTKTDTKTAKLAAKTGSFDVWQGRGDFFDNVYVSPIFGEAWMKACPAHEVAYLAAVDEMSELVEAIRGTAGQHGILDIGPAVSAKLKALVRP